MPKVPSEHRVLTPALGRPDHCYGSSSSTLRLANEFLTSHSLGELLPYRSFDPETQLFLNRSSVGFVIETLPLVGCGEDIPRQLTGIFQHSLPLGSNLQCLLIASQRIESVIKRWESVRKSNEKEGLKASLEELAKERGAYLRNIARGRLSSDQRNSNQLTGISARTFRLLLSYSEPSSTVESLETVLILREQLLTTLKGWGLPVKIWQAEDLLWGLDELLNPSDSLEHPNVAWNIHDALSHQLMSPSTRIGVEPFQLVFGEREQTCSESQESRVMRLYTAHLLPPIWHLGAMGTMIGDPFNEFLRLQGSFFLSYGVHICNEKMLKTQMLAKCGNVEKQAASPIAKYVPSLRKEEEEWRYVREKFEEGQRLVRTRFQVGLLSHPDHIIQEQQTLFNLYRSQRWHLVLDRYLQLPSFLSCLPMTWGEGEAEDSRKFQKAKTTLSHEPSNLMPLQGEWQGTGSPGLLLAGRRGQLFYWFPYDNESGNYNAIVVGRSGSGKSVFMQELVTSFLGTSKRVFVIDIGRSFEKTVKLLGGTYIRFTAKDPICINPFTSISSQNAEATTDALAMLKPVLSLMAAPKEGTRDIEDAFLEAALLKAWSTKKNEATITDVAQFLLTHKDAVAKSLGHRLGSYIEGGIYGRFFHGPASIDLSDNFVVLEMDDLKGREDLQAVIIQMIMVNITNTVYLGDRKGFALICDEGHKSIRGKQTGKLIEEAARTFRKLAGSLIVGTQSINDFYETPGAQAAFENSDWMCLLSQKDESIECLKNSKRLTLDPAMERALRSLRIEQGKYAEIMIKGPNGFAVGRLLLDPFSRILYSTKAEEFTAVQRLVSQGRSLKEAIQAVAEASS